jgi:hypothetical protein
MQDVSPRAHGRGQALEASRMMLSLRPPGDVPAGHPGLTPRVLGAIARARQRARMAHLITDEDGPHEHHW